MFFVQRLYKPEEDVVCFDLNTSVVATTTITVLVCRCTLTEAHADMRWCLFSLTSLVN